MRFISGCGGGVSPVAGVTGRRCRLWPHPHTPNFHIIISSINQRARQFSLLIFRRTERLLKNLDGVKGCSVTVKAEKLKKEREEGKPEKKKRRNARRKPMGPTNSAGEAIEKILQEKKISSKINYDVLKSLNATFAKPESATEEEGAAQPVPTKR